MTTHSIPSPLPRGPRGAGYTIVELLIALLVFGVLITAALGFMNTQNRAFQGGMDKMSGTQTARFALQVLEQDIATAGTNVPGSQPNLVVAGSNVIAFSVDYATRIANNPFAVYYDPDAPNGQVSAPNSSLVIPNTSFTFPDTTYLFGGALSPAELVVFYFEADTSTARDDDYALFRKINTADPELVATNLLAPESGPFFRYLVQRQSGLDSIPDNSLPLTHSIPIHLAVNDTGAVAKIDSVRAVRVRLRATNGLSGTAEEITSLGRVVRMPNLGLGILEACGSEPILGQALSATLTTTPTGEPAVQLAWNRATDEAGGEGDVIRYVIWRRVPGSGWEDPYLSIPAGQTNYTYLDSAVEADATYEYGLAAQDCTPTLSPITASAQVTIP